MRYAKGTAFKLYLTSFVILLFGIFFIMCIKLLCEFKYFLLVIIVL